MKELIENTVMYVCLATLSTITFLAFISSMSFTSDAHSSALSLRDGLKFKSDDGKVTFKLGGRILLDAALFDESKSDMPNGTEVRRTRIHIKGKVHDWKYKSQIDFSDGEVDLKDMWISNNMLRPMYIKVGQFKAPFSLEHMTSSKYITFMERALPLAIPKVHSYGLGLIVGTNGHNWSVTTAIYGEEANSSDGEDEELGASLRATIASVLTSTTILHTGASISILDPDSATESITIKTRPESHIAPNVLNTGVIESVRYFKRYGVETAIVRGPLSLQGEYLWSVIDKPTDNITFDGFYVYGSWFTTGESRKYDVEDGTFGRVIPNADFGYGGLGAVELAVRYSELNLNDVSGMVMAGSINNITVGVNWYFNPRVRATINYVNVNTDSFSTVSNDDPQIYQGRLQIDF